jgi:LDH2 family malate/lactate/ureidoglycolate dehydrogenase
MPDAPITHAIHAADLRRFTAAVFERLEQTPDAAGDAADVLLWANLRGVDTHGVRNLQHIYVDRLDDGVYTRSPCYQILHETPVSATVDGDSGLGLSAAAWAMRLAIAKAEQIGVAFVSMRNTYHFGAAGCFASMALAHDMIGIALTGRFFARGAEIGVVPTFAGKAMFSTNPISVAVPALEEPPFVLDMATSITPYNRVMLYRELGRALPPGWGLDANGQPSIDPATLRQLFPLGGTRELGSHKGYGLAMVVEILCAVLSGGWSQNGSDPERSFDSHSQNTDAHFFSAIRLDAFRPPEEIKRGMDAMIRALHAAPKEPGRDRIYVAGEPEFETMQRRLREGIPLPANVRESLQNLSQRFDLPLEIFPCPAANG